MQKTKVKSIYRQACLLDPDAHQFMKGLAFINGQRLKDAVDEAVWDWIVKIEDQMTTSKKDPSDSILDSALVVFQGYLKFLKSSILLMDISILYLKIR